MKLLVCLGNPGKKYEKTRHNAGWIVADELQHNWGIAPFTEAKHFFGMVSDGFLGQEKILLLKPLTFMNLSGNAVAAVTQFYKIKQQDILLIYDDKDLMIGEVRFREKGSAGGHNGVKDIIDFLKSDAIARIKIGIDIQERVEQMSTSDFVLSQFSASEIDLLQQDVVERVQNRAEQWISSPKE